MFKIFLLLVLRSPIIFTAPIFDTDTFETSNELTNNYPSDVFWKVPSNIYSNETIKSPKFYSSKNGYLLQLKLKYVYNDLMIVVDRLPGFYDDLLPNPISGMVNIQLYNYRGYFSIETLKRHIKPNYLSQYFYKGQYLYGYIKLNDINKLKISDTVNNKTWDLSNDEFYFKTISDYSLKFCLENKIVLIFLTKMSYNHWWPMSDKLTITDSFNNNVHIVLTNNKQNEKHLFIFENFKLKKSSQLFLHVKIPVFLKNIFYNSVFYEQELDMNSHSSVIFKFSTSKSKWAYHFKVRLIKKIDLKIYICHIKGEQDHSLHWPLNRDFMKLSINGNLIELKYNPSKNTLLPDENIEVLYAFGVYKKQFSRLSLKIEKYFFISDL